MQGLRAEVLLTGYCGKKLKGKVMFKLRYFSRFNTERNTATIQSRMTKSM